MPLIELWDAVEVVDGYKRRNPDSWSLCNSIEFGIAEIPTITPNEVRGVGKWEQKEIFGVKETTIEQMQSACCSVCGKYHTTPYSYYFSKYNYCPNCGAKMEVSKDTRKN